MEDLASNGESVRGKVLHITCALCTQGPMDEVGQQVFKDWWEMVSFHLRFTSPDVSSPPLALSKCLHRQKIRLRRVGAIRQWSGEVRIDVGYRPTQFYLSLVRDTVSSYVIRVLVCSVPIIIVSQVHAMPYWIHSNIPCDTTTAHPRVSVVFKTHPTTPSL